MINYFVKYIGNNNIDTININNDIEGIIMITKISNDAE
jgi:hypothetical protein